MMNFFTLKHSKIGINKPDKSVDNNRSKRIIRFLLSIISDDETYQMSIEEKIAYAEKELERAKLKTEHILAYRKTKEEIQRLNDRYKEAVKIVREIDDNLKRK